MRVQPILTPEEYERLESEQEERDKRALRQFYMRERPAHVTGKSLLKVLGWLAITFGALAWLIWRRMS